MTLQGFLSGSLALRCVDTPKTYIRSKFSRGQCLHSQTSHLWLWLVTWRFLSGSIVSFTRKERLEQTAPKASFVYLFFSFTFYTAT